SEFIKEPLNNFGVKLPNGSWNGLIGSVFSNKVHIGCNSLLWDDERVQAVDYLDPTYKA
ncbi:hypothetical protein L9F63_019822, partial [Diploptera punctata]